MILTCPSCGTQYVVKDGAVPPHGRQVRCASCKHSWHQMPDAVAEPVVELTDVAPDEPGYEPDHQPDLEQADEEQSVAEAAVMPISSGPEAEERAFEAAALADEGSVAGMRSGTSADRATDRGAAWDDAAPGAEQHDEWVAPAEAAEQDDFSPFARRTQYAEPERKSRAVPLLLALLLLAALAAALWFLAPPAWKEKLGLAGVGETPLQLMMTHSDRQRLASGNELLAVSGRVINPTQKSQSVPPITAELRSPGGKVVHSWTISPPARVLAPGASATFNSAEVNVPPGGEELTITLGSSKV
jgi:predicted Zn finger-like uncharacterized protein